KERRETPLHASREASGTARCQQTLLAPRRRRRAVPVKRHPRRQTGPANPQRSDQETGREANPNRDRASHTPASPADADLPPMNACQQGSSRSDAVKLPAGTLVITFESEPMKMKHFAAVASFVTLVTSLLVTASFAGGPGYHVVKTYKLRGEGGWDYLTLDPASRHLFISRATHVIVIDADSGKSVGDIPDTPGVHGIALAQEFGRGFISNGREGTVSIFDLNTLKTLNKVKAGENPDAILYDRSSKRVFAFNGRSHDATAIDAENGKVITTLPIGEGVDANAFDQETGFAFASCGEGVLTVAHEDSPDKFNVVENSPTQRGARTMALDPKTHQIFLVTAKFGPPPAASADNPRPRPAILPDSFVVLVVGR